MEQAFDRTRLVTPVLSTHASVSALRLTVGSSPAANGPSVPTPKSWTTPRQFIKELRGLGLSVNEAARLDAVMKRVARGTALPRETKPLREGVSEIKFSGQHREIRVYFAELAGENVLLGLHCQVKKKDRDRNAVDKAAERLRKYLRGEWP